MTGKLTHPNVKAAIDALQAGDSKVRARFPSIRMDLSMSIDFD
jgi:hypothetical protein